jgi:hypothetical protein
VLSAKPENYKNTRTGFHVFVRVPQQKASGKGLDLVEGSTQNWGYSEEKNDLLLQIIEAKSSVVDTHQES